MNNDIKRTVIEGRGLPLRGDDIDTDRIIPARYLKCVTFEELGQYAFIDARFDSSGNEKQHSFNDPAYKGADILIVNKNFGCGSSREHAPQALMRMGIRAIVGESFAEIFSGNCTALGIPTLRSDSASIDSLISKVEERPHELIRVDVVGQSVSIPSLGFTIPTNMNDSYRMSLVEGMWDSTSLLLANLGDIRGVYDRLPYITGY